MICLDCVFVCAASKNLDSNTVYFKHDSQEPGVTYKRWSFCWFVTEVDKCTSGTDKQKVNKHIKEQVNTRFCFVVSLSDQHMQVGVFAVGWM